MFWIVSHSLMAPSNFGTLQNQHDLMHPRVRKPYATFSPGS